MTAVNSGTAFVYFLNTGTASTTANTWLWIMQGTGGGVGTWKTTNGGTTWTQSQHRRARTRHLTALSNRCHYRIIPPVSIRTAPGNSATNAWGVLHSNDLGNTWT